MTDNLSEKEYYVQDPKTGFYIKIDNESFQNLERIYDEVITVESQKNPNRVFILGVLPFGDPRLRAVPSSIIKRV